MDAHGPVQAKGGRGRKKPFSSEVATGAEDVSPALAKGIDRETALLWGGTDGEGRQTFRINRL
jgi:hypothetical protein